ncbi:dethiobiotin synthase [Paraflavitalea sp. CAU 1676]|uniref:dethiobiotin synthase n=1 Tax=Paraflavitalea sp. CAU 1676 TaxID=3032598 RepID=UPI0023DA8627|nr:dethiobiotin synthase [Paraflavitalea sp. CAU 1676]MDF2191917.1 dethiobiotin synthase [Paraflavitalea sp. CAU 1676]
MNKIFVTGIGTGIGKTFISALLARALEADYWKPIQAGIDEGTDSEYVQRTLTGTPGLVHPEAYKLRMPASPHIAAREEGISISIPKICGQVPSISRNLIIEGAGGLMVPLNETEFVADLIKALEAKVILISRNYLGSINHSLLTARVCREMNIPVIGWIFNDQYLHYEEEIVRWTQYPLIASVPYMKAEDGQFIEAQTAALQKRLKGFL